MITRLPTPAVAPEPTPSARFAEEAAAWMKRLIGMSVFGMALVLLFPGFARRSTETLVRRPWASLGLGFGVLVGVPVATMLVFLIGLLIGGWWMAPLAFAAYLGLLPVAFSIVGLLAGQVILERMGRRSLGETWTVLIGLVAIGLVSLVPVLGGIVLFVGLLVGLGAGILALMASYRERGGLGAPAAPPPPLLDESGEPIARLEPIR